jgi:hypothetical protein
MDLGSFLRFNGYHCKHFTHPNDTGVTRVSFDFRWGGCTSRKRLIKAAQAKVEVLRFPVQTNTENLHIKVLDVAMVPQVTHSLKAPGFNP